MSPFLQAPGPRARDLVIRALSQATSTDNSRIAVTEPGFSPRVTADANSERTESQRTARNESLLSDVTLRLSYSCAINGPTHDRLAGAVLAVRPAALAPAQHSNRIGDPPDVRRHFAYTRLRRGARRPGWIEPCCLSLTFAFSYVTIFGLPYAI